MIHFNIEYFFENHEEISKIFIESKKYFFYNRLANASYNVAMFDGTLPFYTYVYNVQVSCQIQFKPVQVDLQVWIFKNSKFFNGKKDLLFVVNFWIPSSLKGSER